MLSMTDTPTCHSTFHTPTLLASSICGTTSQLRWTTGFQAMANSPHSTSADKWPKIWTKESITLHSNKLMDLHTSTSTQDTIHWSATSTSLTKEWTLRLSGTTTRREVSPPHEWSEGASASHHKIYLNSKKSDEIIITWIVLCVVKSLY